MLSKEFREHLGRSVRRVWVERKKKERQDAGLPEIAFPPWEQMEEYERETDRCIADSCLGSAESSIRQLAEKLAKIKHLAEPLLKFVDRPAVMLMQDDHTTNISIGPSAVGNYHYMSLGQLRDLLQLLR